jgi:hypothetical protein
MAPKKTDKPKPPKGLHIENSLWEFARKESLKRGCFHDKAGSSSEFIRRGFKTWILKELPYLKNYLKDVDWAEI